MKQSAIAEAIEAGNSTPLNVYTIEGYSDDMITVDGPNLGNGLEFYHQSDRRVITIQFTSSSGTGLITALLVGDSCWTLGVARLSEDVQLPIGDYRLCDNHGYSPLLKISTPIDQPLTFATS